MIDVAVQGFGGFGLEVPDLQQAEHFYRAFGLQTRLRAEHLCVGCKDAADRNGVLIRGPRKRLHHVSFIIRAGDTDAFADRLRRHGVEVSTAAPDGMPRDGLWCRDPLGMLVNLSESASHAPPAIAALPSNLHYQSARVDLPAWQTLPRDRTPGRIGHLLMFTPDWTRAERFYTGVLGMRVSDRTSGRVVFLCAGEGVIDHHCFGLINSSAHGLQHASFQLPGFDDIGFCVQRMRDAGFREEWGPGRHALGSNLFHYIRDPWGSWIEYYSDLDKIGPDWVARDWHNKPIVWGPEWTPEFWSREMNANHEVG